MDPEERRVVTVNLLGLDEHGATRLFVVLLNGRAHDEIERLGGRIVVDLTRKEAYPTVELKRRERRLHVFVHHFYTGAAPGKGMVIHHANEDKFDNTFENLAVVSRAVHSKHHLMLRKQRRFSPKRGPARGDLYRHKPPRLVPVSASLAELEAAAPHGSSEVKSHRAIIVEAVKETETTLGALVAGLRQEMSWLYVNGRLPVAVKNDPRWDTGRSWMLGLKKPRLELKLSEEAFVLLLMKHGHDVRKVSVATGLHVAILNQLKKRTAVANAVANLVKLSKCLREGASTPPSSAG